MSAPTARDVWTIEHQCRRLVRALQRQEEYATRMLFWNLYCIGFAASLEPDRVAHWFGTLFISWSDGAHVMARLLLTRPIDYSLGRCPCGDRKCTLAFKVCAYREENEQEMERSIAR